MSSADDFSERLDLIAEFVERIGDETIEQVDGQTADGGLIEGYNCAHGDHQYIAITSPEFEYIVLRNTVNIDAVWYAVNMADRQPGDEGVAVSQDDVETARRELESELDAQPPTEKRELRMNLQQILGREGCSVEFDVISNPLNIHGFNIDKKIFERPNGFHVGDFERGVQNIISLGWIGENMMQEYYGLNPESGPGPPGFHPG